MADFVADWTPSPVKENHNQDSTWTLFTDGAWGSRGAGASAILIAPTGAKLRYTASLNFKATNNIAEYEGLILGLSKAKVAGNRILLVKTDSQVVTGHIEKEYTTKEPEFIKYLTAVRALENKFKGFTLKHIPRAENSEAGELAKAVANKTQLPEGVF